jgi:hypothetical protein
MPIELEIIRAAEFIRVGTQGHFDLTASCAVLSKITTACKRRGIERALVDVRDSVANLNPTELAALVNVFRDIGFSRDQRLAILHAEERSHRPRMFAFISRMKGWNVQAFTKFEDAMCWLSEQEGQKPEVRSPARRVPVNHSDAPPRPVSIKAHPARKIASYASVSSNVEMTASRTS